MPLLTIAGVQSFPVYQPRGRGSTAWSSLRGWGVLGTEIAPTEVGDTYLLDVREADEWAAGRAPGSVHVPMSEIQARLAEVPTDRSVAVICRVGARSDQVATWLRHQGYDAANVEGGLLRWQRDGLPLDGRIA